MTGDRPVGSRRLDALDAARGLAMLGVCLSHFGLGMMRREPDVAALASRIGMFASPTFILVSGSLLGYLLANRRGESGGLRLRLVDRGLFLLTVAHATTVLAFYLKLHDFRVANNMIFMTDAIGVALIAGAAIVPRTSARARLAIAGLLYVVGWAIVLTWHPAGDVAVRVKEAFVGTTDLYSKRDDFPLVLWFAVYLAASSLGENLAGRKTSAARVALGERMVRLGPVAIVLAGAVKVAYWLSRPVAWPDVDSMPLRWRAIYELTTPFDKLPPGPTYLLFYGGIASVLVGGLILAIERGWWARLLASVAVVGRASLLVFLLQWFVYWLLVPLLPVPSRLVLIPYFAISIAGLWIAAWGWGRIGGNRFITVGLRAFAERGRGPSNTAGSGDLRVRASDSAVAPGVEAA